MGKFKGDYKNKRLLLDIKEKEDSMAKALT